LTADPLADNRHSIGVQLTESTVPNRQAAHQRLLKDPDRDDSPQILAETAQYLWDFNSAATQSSTALELYGALLEKYPQRANPGALWVGAQAAKPPETR